VGSPVLDYLVDGIRIPELLGSKENGVVSHRLVPLVLMLQL
jgi:hypothetical protein